MAETVETSGLTPLFSKASLKSDLVMVVAKGTTLSVSNKSEAEDCEFGLTPGGYALLKGDFTLPGWATGAPRPKKSCGGGKLAPKGKITWTNEFGAFPDGTKENPQMEKTFTLDVGIPDFAQSKVNVKPATIDGVYSGGYDKKGREIVFVLDATFSDPWTMTVKCKRRVYKGSSTQVFSWEGAIVLSCVCMVPAPPKEEESDDEDGDGANDLLGGDSSSDDSDSDS